MHENSPGKNGAVFYILASMGDFQGGPLSLLNAERGRGFLGGLGERCTVPRSPKP